MGEHQQEQEHQAHEDQHRQEELQGEDNEKNFFTNSKRKKSHKSGRRSIIIQKRA